VGRKTPCISTETSQFNLSYAESNRLGTAKTIIPLITFILGWKTLPKSQFSWWLHEFEAHWLNLPSPFRDPIWTSLRCYLKQRCRLKTHIR